MRLRPEPGGELLVLPVDGDPRAKGLWLLKPRSAAAHYDEATGWQPHRSHAEERAATRPTAPAQAAALLDRTVEPVDGLLYQGPDGGLRPVVVFRSPVPPHAWTALRVAEHATGPRLRRKARGLAAEELVVPAAAARLLEQDLAEPPGPAAPALVQGLPAALRIAVPPVTTVLLAAVMTWLTEDGGVSDLLHRLFFGLPILLGTVSAFGWQLAVDRDGVTVVRALTRTRLPWSRVTAAAVHGGRFTVQGTDGAQHGFVALPSRLLGRGPALQRAARIVTAAAARPERRPAEALPPGTVGATLLLNRLCVAGYLLWILAADLLSRT
ncbi:PH domain-containing protein [Kitasatospora sp. NA04385]|uniref:PH domain-containing protein n=1 Tax=Kitasatospora sp. NA04385 TaxID=2742135 RepID=UPI001590D635|nr:PH domain-containing protein [Kitasatospora sp. NA04385]QKW19809.1 PH domain-containing protein [Kitasatospora sp. NA04385]